MKTKIGAFRRPRKPFSLPIVLGLVVFFGFIKSSFSADAEGVKNRACPDGWSLNTQVIPVVGQASEIPWGVNTNDQHVVKQELAVGSVEETLDVIPVTLDALADDPLSVASECLKYRNMVVDGAEYFPVQNPVTPNPAMGWIPAAVFQTPQ